MPATSQRVMMHAEKGDVSAHWRKNPHVQSYLVATDQVGLNILLQDQNVFACFEDMSDTIYHSELGSSKVLLDAGYNIDSLMVCFALFGALCDHGHLMLLARPCAAAPCLQHVCAICSITLANVSMASHV